MTDLKKAIDLIDDIDGMPFGQVPGALDRLRALIVKAQREALPDNLRAVSYEQHHDSHRRAL